jgi:predicted nucleic acid-binding protein
VQVLNEVTNVARRKMHLSWTETHQFLSMIRTLLTVHALSGEVHEEGVSLAERHGFSIYDAMIVASALLAECDTLWTEDMQHGMMIGSRLRIVDPFRQA